MASLACSGDLHSTYRLAAATCSGDLHSTVRGAATPHALGRAASGVCVGAGGKPRRQ